MRVIAGTRKGLRLQVPPGHIVRPTPDRVREALMSILGGFFDGEQVLDLCAGTGAMGIELLSRGCGGAVFVEQGADALRALRANLAKARFDLTSAPRAEVVASSLPQALSALKKRGARFDYVYVDPPYDAGLYTATLSALADGALLRGGAEIWVESRVGLDLTTLPAGLSHQRARRFGGTTLDLLTYGTHDH